MAAAVPPLAAISCATASQASALRLEITTLAPSPAMLSAMARPMPRLDPVITATLSSRRNGVVMGRCDKKRERAACSHLSPLAGREPAPDLIRGRLASGALAKRSKAGEGA